MKSLLAISQAKLSNLQAAVVSAITAAAGLAVSFGLLSQAREQVLVSAAGIIIGAAVQVYAALES